MMKLCPTCHRDLDEVERMGVAIDLCPKCRGIWLDEGELEQVSQALRTIESAEDASTPASRFNQANETSTRHSCEDTPTPKHSFFHLLNIFRQR